MSTPRSFPHPPPLTLLLLRDAPPDAAWSRALASASAAFPEAEPLVIGHGPPPALAPALRALAAAPPWPRVEMTTHPQGTTAALVAGVRASRGPWVLWLPRLDDATAGRIGALRQRADATGAGVLFCDAAGACLFRRDSFLQLPRIPGMHRLLPELFARHVAAPLSSDRGGLRRAYVAVACTMGLGWTPSRRIA